MAAEIQESPGGKSNNDIHIAYFYQETQMEQNL